MVIAVKQESPSMEAKSSSEKDTVLVPTPVLIISKSSCMTDIAGESIAALTVIPMHKSQKIKSTKNPIFFISIEFLSEFLDTDIFPLTKFFMQNLDIYSKK